MNFNLTGGVWTPDSDVDLALTNEGSAWTLTDSNDSVETYATATATEAVLTAIEARAVIRRRFNVGLGMNCCQS